MVTLGYGFMGLRIAIIGAMNPWGVALASLLFSSLLIGGGFLQRSLTIPASLVDVISGMTILFLLAGSLLTKYRLRISLRGGE